MNIFSTQGDYDDDNEFLRTAKFPKWKQHSVALRTKFGFSRGWCPWSSRMDVQMRGGPRTPRCLDLIDIAWGVRLEQHKNQCLSDTELRAGFFVDLSQGCERKPWGDLSVMARGDVLM